MLLWAQVCCSEVLLHRAILLRHQADLLGLRAEKFHAAADHARVFVVHPRALPVDDVIAEVVLTHALPLALFPQPLCLLLLLVALALSLDGEQLLFPLATWSFHWTRD